MNPYNVMPSYSHSYRTAITKELVNDFVAGSFNIVDHNVPQPFEFHIPSAVIYHDLLGTGSIELYCDFVQIYVDELESFKNHHIGYSNVDSLHTLITTGQLNEDMPHEFTDLVKTIFQTFYPNVDWIRQLAQITGYNVDYTIGEFLSLLIMFCVVY